MRSFIGKFLLLAGVAGMAVWWSCVSQEQPPTTLKSRTSIADTPVVKPILVPPRPLPPLEHPYHGLAWQIHHSEGGVAGMAVWWSCVSQEQPPTTLKSRTSIADTPVVKPILVPPRPLPPLEHPYHGLAWQIHHSEGCVDTARRLLGEMADLGADAVLISNAGYQEHAGSASFRIDPNVTPSEAQWLEIFKIAHSHGLRVILMPIILLSDPRGSEWRGVINPPSWDDWFEQYRDFLLHFARIAQKGGVDVMTVGSELISTETYTARWHRLIRDVRKVFTGKLSYSANWDHYKAVEFWDELDLVGMTSYYKLAAEPNPSLESLIEAWKPIKRGILRWQRDIGKPLLFTEAGWCSQEGASIEPWNYYYKQDATAAGLKEQENCYQAFIETWARTPQVGGVLWWEWNESAGGTDDYNYTPRGKPAEEVLRQWFASNRPKADIVQTPASRPGL